MNKLGRNDKCHCGSNKKYKKCCLMRDELEKDQGGVIGGVLRGPLPAGEDDDFMNRFVFGIGKIRDAVIKREERQNFDKDFDVIFQNLVEAKLVKNLCKQYMERHRKDIMEKRDGIITGHQINVKNPVDDELNIFFKDFFIRNSMAVNGLKMLTKKWFGYDISFLFTNKKKDFERGAIKFKIKKDEADFEVLKKFIETNRSGWYDDFKNFRNRIEHEGYKLPIVKYKVDENRNVHAIYPFDNSSQPINKIFDVGWNNLLVLCEEVIIFIMSRELKDPFIIIKVPEEERKKYNWVKYRVVHKEFPEAQVSF